MTLKNLKKLLFVLTSLPIIACSQSQGGNTSSSDALAYLKGGEGEWVLKIDDMTVNQTNFNRDLKASLLSQGATEEQVALYINNDQFKQYYSEMLIRDALLLKKAEEEKFFDSDEAKSVINSAIRNMKAQYYLQKLMTDAAKTIPEPTAEQAQAFFEQAKPQIAQMYGITEYNTQTAPDIAQLYKNAYAQQLVERDITDLKDKAVIERNTAVLGEASILPPQVGDTNNAALPQQGASNTAVLPQQGVDNNNLLPRTNN